MSYGLVDRYFGILRSSRPHDRDGCDTDDATESTLEIDERTLSSEETHWGIGADHVIYYNKIGVPRTKPKGGNVNRNIVHPSIRLSKWQRSEITSQNATQEVRNMNRAPDGLLSMTLS